MNQKAFLLAAGCASRWNGLSKQKICVRGEMLIDRLIRQIRKYTDDITIIAWDQTLRREGAKFINTRHKTESFSHTLLLTLDHWGDLNYIFATDTYYSDKFIERVFQEKEQAFFGYYTRPPKYIFRNQERAAICFPLRWKDRIERGLMDCVTEARTHKTHVHNEMIASLMWPAGFRWYRHLEKTGIVAFIAWKLKPLMNTASNFVEINDETSEFDTPEEFKNWCVGRPKYHEAI